MTDTSEQLLPCPFCGGAPRYNPRQPADISCENYECPVIVETDVGAFGYAVKIWNTRTPRPLDAEVDAARANERVLRESLSEMVYAATHLNAMDPTGAHACTISGNTLAKARAALAKSYRESKP